MTFLPDLNVMLAYTVAAVILVITPGPDMTLFLGQTLTGRASIIVAGRIVDKVRLGEEAAPGFARGVGLGHARQDAGALTCQDLLAA